MFEQSSLPQAEDDKGTPVVRAGTEDAQGRAPCRLARHDSKLTAMMDDQPDEDYWCALSMPETVVISSDSSTDSNYACIPLL